MNSEKYSSLIKLFLLAVLFTPLSLRATVDLRGFNGSGLSYNVQQGSAAWGEDITVSFAVANFGNQASGSFNVRFYLSTDSTITTSDYALSNHLTIPSINALSANSFTANLTLPGENAVGGSGTFYVGIIIDSLNQIGETNESNNSNLGNGIDRDSLSISIPNADLRGYDGRPGNDVFFDVQETALEWGGVMNLKFSVINDSGGNAGTFVVKLYVSADTNIGDANDFVLQTVTFSSGLDAFFFGGFSTYTEVSLPSFNPLPGAPTNVYIGMVVDADNQVTESNEANNNNQGNPLDLDGPITITDPQPNIQITDSTTPTNDLVVDFGNVVDDGLGESRGVQTIRLTNTGLATLTVSSVSISGNNQFSIVDSVSSIENTKPLSSLPDVIASNGDENWIITVQYDPVNTSSAMATLSITSDDPDQSTVNVTLQGSGDPIQDIAVIDPTIPESDLSVDYGGILNDGSGGTKASQTIQLINKGSGPLIVSQNGISLLTGTVYSIVSITSSTQGTIDLSAGTATLAPDETETWSIVVDFDPVVLGQADDGIEIQSDDPDEAIITVSLTGKGLAPMDIAVTDSVLPDNDLSIAFTDTHADGSGQQAASAAVTVKNIGEAPLTISQNGVSLVNGTHFQIQSIESNTQGTIDLGVGSVELAASQQEIWVINLLFDPSAPGNQSTTLNIQSDDPDEPVTGVALSGVGLNEPDLKVVDSQGDPNDKSIDYSFTLNDGAGNQTKQETVTISNIGAQPLVVGQDGIIFATGTDYAITSIVSSSGGAVNLSSSDPFDRTIDPAGAETWTVTLAFDPASNAAFNDTLQIQSDDPDSPQTNLSLSGTGEQPQIANLADQLTGTTNISASTIFEITWADTYQANDAQIELFIDTDTNPADGLVSLVNNISEDDSEDVYDWQPDTGLEGSEYYLYATITDGSVTNSVYSTEKVKIDSQGSFNLRSAAKSANSNYAYEFEYKGTIYTGVTTLSSGNNVVSITVPVSPTENATVQFEVELVDSLMEPRDVTYDSLNQIKTSINGNGIVTTFYYNPIGLLEKTESSNGAKTEFKYDNLKRRIEMIDSVGYVFYEYDELDHLTARITSKNSVNGDSDDVKISYEYYNDGLIKRLVYPSGEDVRYTYDDAGRLKTVINQTRSLTFQYNYNATSGLLENITRPNGVTTEFLYDNMARVRNVRHEKSGVLIGEYDYVVHPSGAAQELTINLPSSVTRKENYEYFDFSRIKSVIYSDDGIIDSNDLKVSYTYDQIGNRLTQVTEENEAVQQMLSYSYGNENRLLKITDQSGNVVNEYRYDAAGNRIQKVSNEQTTSYSYDERNMLVSFIDEQNHLTFQYDGSGHRVQETKNGTAKNFVVDPSRQIYEVLEERDENGQVTAIHTYGRVRLFTYYPQQGTTVYYLTDRIGSVRHTLDTTGNSLQTYEYDVFGARR